MQVDASVWQAVLSALSQGSSSVALRAALHVSNGFQLQLHLQAHDPLAGWHWHHTTLHWLPVLGSMAWAVPCAQHNMQQRLLQQCSLCARVQPGCLAGCTRSPVFAPTCLHVAHLVRRGSPARDRGVSRAMHTELQQPGEHAFDCLGIACL